MSGYFIKGPEEQSDYAVDWGINHLADGEVLISDLGWTITPNTAVPGELAAMGHSIAGNVTTITLGGGRAGVLYAVTSKVLTSDNRILTHTIALRVASEV